MRLEGVELENFNKKVSALKNFMDAFPGEKRTLEKWLKLDGYFSLEEMFSENAIEEFDVFYDIYERIYMAKSMYGLREERSSTINVRQFLKENFGNLAFLCLEVRNWYFKESNSELIKEIAKKIANVFKSLDDPTCTVKEHIRAYLYSVCRYW